MGCAVGVEDVGDAEFDGALERHEFSVVEDDIPDARVDSPQLIICRRATTTHPPSSSGSNSDNDYYN